MLAAGRYVVAGKGLLFLGWIYCCCGMICFRGSIVAGGGLFLLAGGIYFTTFLLVINTFHTSCLASQNYTCFCFL